MNDDEFSMKKMHLSSVSLANFFNIDKKQVIKDILNIYEVLLNETDVNKCKNYTRHVDDLYHEWLLDYHSNSEYIDITKIDNIIGRLINEFDLNEIDSYKLIFAMETYFIMIVKLLVANFFEHFKNKHDVPDELSWSYIAALFRNNNITFDDYLKDLFEVSYYEWFVSVNRKNTSKIYEILNDIWINVNLFDINPTINLKSLYGLFNGLYCNFFDNYFDSFYKGFNQETSNSLPNFCSLVVAKAINVLIRILDKDKLNVNGLASTSLYVNNYNLFETSLNDTNIEILIVRTSVGNFKIPKLDSFQNMESFIDQLHYSILVFKSFDSFWKMIQINNNYGYKVKIVASRLYEKLMLLRTSIQYDFWTPNIKRKITPALF